MARNFHESSAGIMCKWIPQGQGSGLMRRLFMDKELESREFAEAYNSTLKQAERVTKENGRDISLAKDAVQETVLRLLVRKRKEEIRNWLAFLTTSVRRTLVKLIKHDELSQKVQSLAISQVNSAEKIYNHILISELENQVPEKELEIV